MKHVPFDSTLRPNFAVVEQRLGAVSYFPHTDQLPILHRALNLDFRGALPSGIAKVNAKSDGFRKKLLSEAVSFYCDMLHTVRRDQVVLVQLHDFDLLARVALMQQVTENTRLGKCHRFKYFAGADFAPEIYLSGKEIIFSDHALQRFTERVPHAPGQQLALLFNCFHVPCLAAPVNGGRAFLVWYDRSFLAFPFQESSTEYFITSCLSIREIHSLEPEIPPQAFNCHYGRDFRPPRVRTWLPLTDMLRFYHAWEIKQELKPILEPLEERNWYRMASFVKPVTLKQGFGPGTQLRFCDDLPGPAVNSYRPGEKPGAWDELADYQRVAPEVCWLEEIRRRDEKARRQVPVFAGVGRGG